MARPRGFEPLTYRFVARSEEGFENNQGQPSTTKDDDTGDGEG
jgi:hypothetical protein